MRSARGRRHALKLLTGTISIHVRRLGILRNGRQQPDDNRATRRLATVMSAGSSSQRVDTGGLGKV